MLPQAGSAECTESGDQEGVVKFRNLSWNRSSKFDRRYTIKLQYLDVIGQLNTETADIYDENKEHVTCKTNAFLN